MRTLSPPLNLVITTDAVGGVWRYALDLAGTLKGRALAVADDAPQVVEPLLIGLGPRPSEAQRDEAYEAGVALDWIDRPLDWQVEGPEALSESGRALAAAVTAAGADLVQVNNPPLLPFLPAQLPRIAAAHSCLSTWWQAVRGETPPLNLAWHGAATARGLAASDAVISPSHAFAAAMTEIYGPVPDLAVVPNAAVPVMAGRKRQVALAAARWWDPAKNLTVLDAAAEGALWPVEIAGPLEGPGSSGSGGAGSGGAGPRPVHVTHLGSLPHRALRARMAEAAIFVSLALYEPFGLSVLEAAGAGAALVLSDIPTHRELWDDCACFVDPHDPHAVRDALDGLVRDPAALGRMGLLATTRAATFSHARQADAMLAVYARVLARHTADRGDAVP
ncbi:glycosyltransferase (plasmid) [Tistrella mobilis]|uniref:glycosyltransferase n=1 Tax=Tistrella mobilis TaxID=171437 RepID=UPI00355674C9